MTETEQETAKEPAAVDVIMSVSELLACCDSTAEVVFSLFQSINQFYLLNKIQ